MSTTSTRKSSNLFSRLRNKIRTVNTLRKLMTPKSTPLPPNWISTVDNHTKRTVYYNKRTGESSWVRPKEAEDEFKQGKKVKKRNKIALLVVNMQKDFFQSGNLPVPNAERILPKVEELCDIEGMIVCHVRLSRPSNHASFFCNNPGSIFLNKVHGIEHEMYVLPAHCVQGTNGAQLHDSLQRRDGAMVVDVGGSPSIDDFSPFTTVNETVPLEDILRAKNVAKIFVVGIGLETAVQTVALDAQVYSDADVYVIIDAVADLGKKWSFSAASDQAQKRLQSANINIIDTPNARELISKSIKKIKLKNQHPQRNEVETWRSQSESELRADAMKITPSSGKSKTHLAIINCNMAYLEAAARSGVAFSHSTSFGEPCIILAVQSGRSEQDVCKMLLLMLHWGASPYQRDTKGRTALMWAVILQQTSVVKSLIDHLLQPILNILPPLDDSTRLFRLQTIVNFLRLKSHHQKTALMFAFSGMYKNMHIADSEVSSEIIYLLTLYWNKSFIFTAPSSLTHDLKIQKTLRSSQQTQKQVSKHSTIIPANEESPAKVCSRWIWELLCYDTDELGWAAIHFAASYGLLHVFPIRQIFSHNFNFNISTKRGYNVLHLCAWNGQHLNLEMLFHGTHLTNSVWIGSRKSAWLRADALLGDKNTSFTKGKNGNDPKRQATKVKQRPLLQSSSEKSLDSHISLCSTACHTIISWLPAIDTATPTPSVNRLPSVVGSQNMSKRHLLRQEEKSTTRIDSSEFDINMTAIDLVLMRGHIRCAKILSRAACPVRAFGVTEKASYCVNTLQRRTRQIGKLRSRYVRPILKSVPQLLSLAILQGDVLALMGLLKGNERYCNPDRNVLQFCRQIRSFDTCTFNFTSYHSPVEQYIFHCKLCDANVCMMCAIKCHLNCYDNNSGCTAEIEVNEELSTRPTYCDCNKRTCRSLASDLNDSRITQRSNNNLTTSPRLHYGSFNLMPQHLLERAIAIDPPDVENTATTVGERLDLFGPSGSLIAVATAIAQNTHQSWAMQKLADEWKYAPSDSKPSDNAKTTPLLLPFHKLPPAIKTQNINIVVETFKVMYHYGYEILVEGAKRHVSAIREKKTCNPAVASTRAEDDIAKPIDLSGTDITRGEMELAEMLARNAHAIWVHGKLKRGWIYKPKWLEQVIEQDDSPHDNRKSTSPSSPLLVPYEQLPPSEKLWNRREAYNLLKLLKKMGFTVKPPAALAFDLHILGACNPIFSKNNRAAAAAARKKQSLVARSLTRKRHVHESQKITSASKQTKGQLTSRGSEKHQALLVKDTTINNTAPVKEKQSHSPLGVARVTTDPGEAANECFSSYDSENKIDKFNATKKSIFESLMYFGAKVDRPALVSAILLDQGDSVNAQNVNGHTILHLAALYHNIELAKLLLQPLLAQQTLYNETPQVKRSMTMMARDFSEDRNDSQNIIDLEIQDRNGMTPLLLSAYEGDEKLVCLLLSAKADVTIFDYAGMQALHHAATQGYSNIVQLLLHCTPDNGSLNIRQTNIGVSANNAKVHPLSSKSAIERRSTILMNTGCDGSEFSESLFCPAWLPERGLTNRLAGALPKDLDTPSCATLAVIVGNIMSASTIFKFNPKLAIMPGADGLPSPYELVLLAYDDFFGDDGLAISDSDEDQHSNSLRHANNKPLSLNSKTIKSNVNHKEVGILRSRFVKRHISQEAERFRQLMKMMTQISVVRKLRAQFAGRHFFFQIVPLMIVTIALIFFAPCAPDFSGGVEYGFDPFLPLPGAGSVSDLQTERYVHHTREDWWAFIETGFANRYDSALEMSDQQGVLLDDEGSIFGSQLYAIDTIELRQLRIGNHTTHTCWASQNSFMGFKINASANIKSSICNVSDTKSSFGLSTSTQIFEHVFLSHTNVTNRSASLTQLQDHNWINSDTRETLVSMGIINILTGRVALLEWSTLWSSGNSGHTDFKRASARAGGRYSPSVFFDVFLIALLAWLALSRVNDGATLRGKCNNGVKLAYRKRAGNNRACGFTASENKFSSNLQAGGLFWITIIVTLLTLFFDVATLIVATQMQVNAGYKDGFSTNPDYARDSIILQSTDGILNDLLHKNISTLAVCETCLRVCFAILVILLGAEILVNARLVPRWGPIVIGVIATISHVTVLLYFGVLLFFLMMMSIVLQVLVSPVVDSYYDLAISFGQAFRMLFDFEWLFVQHRKAYEYTHIEPTHIAISSAEGLQNFAVGLVFYAWCIIGIILLNLFIGIITELYPKMQLQSEQAWENLITGIMAHATRSRVLNETSSFAKMQRFNEKHSSSSHESSLTGVSPKFDADSAITNVCEYIEFIHQHRWGYVLRRHSPFLTHQHAYDVVYARVIHISVQLSIVWERQTFSTEAEIYRGSANGFGKRFDKWLNNGNSSSQNLPKETGISRRDVFMQHLHGVAKIHSTRSEVPNPLDDELIEAVVKRVVGTQEARLMCNDFLKYVVDDVSKMYVTVQILNVLCFACESLTENMMCIGNSIFTCVDYNDTPYRM